MDSKHCVCSEKLKNLLSSHDADKDGKVTVDEMRSAAKECCHKCLDRLEANLVSCPWTAVPGATFNCCQFELMVHGDGVKEQDCSGKSHSKPACCGESKACCEKAAQKSCCEGTTH